MRGEKVNQRQRAAMSELAARQVAANGRRWWHNSTMALHLVLPNKLFDDLGVPRLAA